MTIPNTSPTNEHTPHAPSTRHDSRPGSAGVVRSECDGVEALWQLTHDDAQAIAIIHAHNTFGDTSIVRFPPGTDLVAAREQYPAWNSLWDKISAEFWGELRWSRTAHEPDRPGADLPEHRASRTTPRNRRTKSA